MKDTVLSASGASPREALEKAKRLHGEDLSLIDTKTIREKGINQSPLYEVRFLVNKDNSNESTSKDKPSNTAPQTIQDYSVKTNQNEATNKTLIQRLNEKQESVRKTLIKNDKKEEKEQNSNQDYMDISKESDVVIQMQKDITSVLNQMNLIKSNTWLLNQKSHKNHLNIPPEFSEIYKVAVNSGIESKHINELMEYTIQHLPMKHRQDLVHIKKYFRYVIRKTIATKKEDLSNNNSKKKIILLVGPTGVGKTTSIAKLAARYSLYFDKKYRVSLVVLDNYKIGALEQLKIYANKMRLNINFAVDDQEFNRTLDSIGDFDYVLVDTMGSSPNDNDKLLKLKNCTNVEGNYDKEVSLVLPSNLSYSEMMHIYNSFSMLDIDSIIFTKLDEAKNLGAIYSFLYDTEKDCSYIATGQCVPDDFLVATNDTLTDYIIEGFSKK